MSKRKDSEIFSSMAYGPAPEAADSAKAWIESHGGAFGHFINGAFVKPKGRKTYTSVDPCSGKALATTLVGENADIDEAVAAARAAYPSWSATPGHVRARHLYAVARCINKHHRLFAVLESMDNGKTIRETRDADLALVIRHFYHHAGWAQLFDKEMAGFAPVGVIGQVIPWNFPLLMLAWKIAPALAMGNTVVLKPAPYTSLTALLFCQVLAEAGVPAGVVNIVTGGAEPGGYLCTHPGVDKVAFTGSTRVGQLLRRETAGSGVKLSLELGGKSPTIVFDSADLDSAVEAIVSSIWFNQGQVCCAGSRLLVQENVSESLVAKLKWRLGKMRVGASLDKCMDSGAMVDRLQCDLDLDLALHRVHTPSRDTPRISHPPHLPLSPQVRSGDGVHPDRSRRRGRRGDAGAARRRRRRPRPLHPAHPRVQRQLVLEAGAGGDLRPRAHRPDVPLARRGGEAREQHAVRAGGLGPLRVDRARARGRDADPRRRDLGELGTRLEHGAPHAQRHSSPHT